MSGINNTIAFLNDYLDVDSSVVTQKRIDAMKLEAEEGNFYESTLPRILVLGRFKAGKSTLLNALMGRELAAVDVLEKTAWIARYWPAKEDFCVYNKRDNTVVKSEIGDFIRKTQNNEFSEKELGEIYRVDVGYKCDDPRFSFIDTPGFGANKDNEMRAIESIKDADLILYVVDVNKIGDQYETAVISKLRESRVPMICVATKYDGDIVYEKSPDDIRNSLTKFSVFKKNEIFPVSAREYMKDASEGNMGELIDYLEKVKSVNLIFRENANNSRTMRMNTGAIDVLRKLQKEINGSEALRRNFELKYEHYRTRVRREMEIFIADYVRKTLYIEYRDKMVRAVSVMAKGGDTSVMTGWLENILPPDYMDVYWKQLTCAVKQKLDELWSTFSAEADFSDLIEDAFSDYSGNRGIELKNVLNEMSGLGHSQKLNDEGIRMSFKAAGFAAFYQAVLGANAASIILPTALVTTGIPVALLGIGITKYLVGKYKSEC
ncbi:MAG: 50S ribosome-binding GTPase, partial [Acetatifactor sp.]|nr:50S ribosome-binding GTPase [Acetatifactor sp.]